MFDRKSALAVVPWETLWRSSSSSAPIRSDDAIESLSDAASVSATRGESAMAPVAVAATTRITSSGVSSVAAAPPAPPANDVLSRATSSTRTRTTMRDEGDAARMRPSSSVPVKPSMERRHSTTSGRVRAAVSSARSASVETSTMRSG